MPTVAWVNYPKFKVINGNTSAPVSGGYVYTYIAGTTTPLATYTSSSGLVTNSNPIVLDSAGEANVWLIEGSLYKFIITDGDTSVSVGGVYGTILNTIDNIDAGGFNPMSGGFGIGGDLQVFDYAFTDSNANRYIKFATTISAVNYFGVTNASTGNPPIFSAQGSDSNVGLNFTAKGSGTVKLTGGAGIVSVTNTTLDITSTAIKLLSDQAILDSSGNGFLAFTKTTSANTGFRITNAATGTDPIFRASGEANRGIRLQDSNSNALLTLISAASAVNSLSITNAGAGSSPVVKVVGGDANRGLIIQDSSSTPLLTLTSVPSAVNALTLTASGTGSAVLLAASGTDTNIPLFITPKGTGILTLGSGSGRLNITSGSIRLLSDQAIEDSSGNNFIAFSKAASAVNSLTVANAATGNPPSIKTTGESNTGLELIDSNNNKLLKLISVASGTSYLSISNANAGSIALINNGSAGFTFTDSSTRTITLSNGNISSSTGSSFNISGGADVTLQANALYRFSNAVTTSNTGITFNTDTNFPSIRPQVTTATTQGLKLLDGNSADVLRLLNGVGTAVNYFTMQPIATGSGPTLASAGSDTNIALNITSKGTGNIVLTAGAGTVTVTNTGTTIPTLNSTTATIGTLNVTTLALSSLTVSTVSSTGDLTLSANSGSNPLVLTSSTVKLTNDQPIVDSSNNEYIKFSKTASAVNEITIKNAATGVSPTIQSSGESNRGLILADSNGNEGIIIASTASAVNEVTITNKATGNGPTIAATGGDSNIALNINSKGTGDIVLTAGAGTVTVTNTGTTIPTLSSTTIGATTGNITTVNSTTTNATTVASSGNLTISANSGSNPVIITSTEARLNSDQPITDSSGNEFIKFAKTASAVNEITVTNKATGNAPSISATGGDTNIGLALVAKGTGQVSISGYKLPNTIGTNGYLLASNGTDTVFQAPPPFKSCTLFTASGTFTSDASTTKVFVRVWGAGGGGGAATAGGVPGAGGAGGAYSEGFLTVTASTGYSITVGSGGAGASVAGATGTSGGTSSFASSISCTGGAGGASGGGSSTGGTPTGGDFTVSGGAGQTATSAYGGAGGNTYGFTGGMLTTAGAGLNGFGYGAGGAGSGPTVGGSGGNGANGVVAVYY